MEVEVGVGGPVTIEVHVVVNIKTHFYSAE